MINARTKYMAQLVAEAFNVQEYETSVSNFLLASSARLAVKPVIGWSIGFVGSFEIHITVGNPCVATLLR